MMMMIIMIKHLSCLLLIAFEGSRVHKCATPHASPYKTARFYLTEEMNLEEIPFLYIKRFSSEAEHILRVCEEGKPSQLKFPIDRIFEARDRFGNTAIIKAARNKNISCLKHLLRHCQRLGRDAFDEETNFSNRTALHEAVTLGRIEAVRLLLSHNHSVNKPDDHGNTPLHLLFQSESINLDIFKTLVSFGADMFVVNCVTESSLQLCFVKHKEIPAEILSFLSDLNSKSVLSIAAQYASLQVFGQIFEQTTCDSSKEALFQDAVSAANEEVAVGLLNMGAAISVSLCPSGISPLVLAIMYNQQIVWETILNKTEGADNLDFVDRDGQHPVLAAIAIDNEKLLSNLLRAGFRNYSLFGCEVSFAIQHNAVSCLKFLLRQGHSLPSSLPPSQSEEIRDILVASGTLQPEPVPGVPRLKHLCRMAVRESMLRPHCSLFYFVTRLPNIPPSIRSFLLFDVQSDNE